MSIPVIVSPPPWQSPAAYLLYFLIAVAMLGYFVRRQRLQATLAMERQRELEQKVAERTEDLQEARIAAEAANKAKSDFLATMSHEIRTPMHGMVGMTELLMHTDLNEQQKRFASAAHKSGEALIQLINDILDFSKLEASKIELEEITFSLSDVIDEICYLQSEPAARKGLCLYNICDANEKFTLIGDPTKLRQVIMNLISNAIKFTNEGHVKVVSTVKSDEESLNGIVVRIDVADTGIGMDEETQNKIFDAFTQADASTTRKFGGTGLGLSISKQFVEMMGGEILVDSELGVGTEISIEIPFRIAERDHQKTFQGLKATVFSNSEEMSEMICAHTASLGLEVSRVMCHDDLDTLAMESDIFISDIFTASDNPQLNDIFLSNNDVKGLLVTPLTVDPEELKPYSNWRRTTFPLTRSSLTDSIESLRGRPEREDRAQLSRSTSKDIYRVLVAEDVEVNQRIATEMLSILHCEVHIAANGLEAVKQCEKTVFDLVFMDCQMPELDGYSATMRIREMERYTGRTRVPIIALTAGTEKQDKIRCQDAGMDNYLSKPFSLADINRILKKHLGTKSDVPQVNSSYLANGYRSPESEYATAEPAEVVKASAIKSIREVEKQTGKALLPSLIDGYRAQVKDKLGDLRDAINSRDSDICYKAAHAIKSMSANVGAEKVRQIAAQIESSGRAGDIEEVKNTFILVEPAVKEYLSEIQLNIESNVD
jgi:signal transduction histidine kinase/CheY-like chemotaxis protein/HPt (histidine-containing phosphotransfer) domain-containing protein